MVRVVKFEKMLKSSCSLLILSFNIMNLYRLQTDGGANSFSRKSNPGRKGKV